MYSCKHTTRTILATAFALVFASAAYAAESGTGDKGPNNGQAGMSSTTTGTPSARAMARRNYNAALTSCKTMASAERASCRKEARTTRDKAYADAKMANRSSAPMSSAGGASMKAPTNNGSAAGSTSATGAASKSSATMSSSGGAAMSSTPGPTPGSASGSTSATTTNPKSTAPMTSTPSATPPGGATEQKNAGQKP